jgi:transposase-like protein
MTRRRYSDNERAEALAMLAANGGALERTAAQLGIPEATLRHWATGRRHPGPVHLYGEKKAQLSGRLEDLAHLLLDEMARPAKRRAASLQQAATSFAIAVDKMRLLREQPTMIPGPAPDPRKMTDEQLTAEIESLRRARAGASQGGEAPGNGEALAPPGGPGCGPASPPEAGGRVS